MRELCYETIDHDPAKPLRLVQFTLGGLDIDLDLDVDAGTIDLDVWVDGAMATVAQITPSRSLVFAGIPRQFEVQARAQSGDGNSYTWRNNYRELIEVDIPGLTDAELEHELRSIAAGQRPPWERALLVEVAARWTNGTHPPSLPTAPGSPTAA